MKTSHPVWGREALTTPLLHCLNKSVNPSINLIKAQYIGHEHIITATSGECNPALKVVSLLFEPVVNEANCEEKQATKQ